MLWFPFCRCEEVLGGPPTIVAIDINGKKTNRFLPILMNIEIINLPRQAWDKHRKHILKGRAFFSCRQPPP